MEKLKAVIVGGCSYCAGDELAGELLVPGYTDKKWRPGYEDRELYEVLRLQMRPSHKKFRKYLETCLERSWVGHLDKIVTTPVKNISRGGASNQEISYRLMKDAVGRCKKSKTLRGYLYICSLSSPARLAIMNSDDKHNISTINISRSIHDMSWYVPGAEKFVEKMYFAHDDDDFLWYAVSGVLALREYITMHGGYFMIVDTGLWHRFVNELEDKRFAKQLESLLHANLNFFAVASTFRNLSGGHVEEAAHEKFANVVKNTIKKKYNV